MIKNKNKNKKIRLIVSIILIGFLVNTYGTYFAGAASSNDTVDLRIVFTTDLHGQLNSVDYETGKAYNNGGLSKAFSLIKTARNQKPKGNTLTFDIGDVLYDYTTEFIYGEDQSALQPIYNAMTYVGYDAIVLGNHDYDYGYQYILNQLNKSGLRDITVASNVWEADTGNSPFLPYMLLDKELVVKGGKNAKVKIGIIGESIPNLSSKTSSYAGILKTEDMVTNVKWRSKQLKEMGADIIIVIAHTGMGPEEPAENYKNVAYALTKIDEIDVVLCGHEHNMFPTPDNTNNVYYNLPGVDSQTGLINGKAVVMASDRGQSIGLVDLTLKKDGTNYIIEKANSEIRKVNPSTAKEDAKIKAAFEEWKYKLLEYSNNVVAKVESGTVIHNYFGLVGDNASIQLLNDAKRAYGISSINTISTEYKDLPVIAVSKYNKYGQGSISDYVYLKGDIIESQLSTIQMYNSYLHLYKITGKQLKEWLEWSASAYEYSNKSDIAPLVGGDWLGDWENFFVFDGIYYEITPSILPRYNKNGVKINNTKRITKLLYNGKEILDSMEFAIASDKITKTTQATSNLDKQQIQKGFSRSQKVLTEYVEQLGETGDIKNEYNNNWKILYPKNYQFLVESSPLASSFAKTEKWYKGTLDEQTVESQYHIGNFDYLFDESYIETPNLILISTNKELTNKDVEIIVDATDSKGIKKIQYLKGDYDLGAYEWSNAIEVKNKFKATENGIYSVLATSNAGKSIVSKIKIANINKGILQAPKVDNYTNKKTKITGTAEPYATIYFEVGRLLYEAEVDKDGKFSYAMPANDADTKIYAYVKDGEGRVSEKTKVNVKRTGPNRLTLSKVTNKKIKLTGKNAEDGVQIIAIIGSTVYVSKKGGKAAYESCNIYSKDYDIVETSVSVGQEEKGGNYSLKIPIQYPGTKITVYAIDYGERVSRKITKTVKEVAPNPPYVDEVCNGDLYISGTVDSSNTIDEIIVSIEGNVYYTKVDENGKYKVKVGKLNIGEIINVYAQDIVDEVERISYRTKVVAADVETYDFGEYASLVINPITDKAMTITGEYEAYESFSLTIGSETYDVEAGGFNEFIFELDEPLAEGTKIYAVARYENGEIAEAKAATVIKAKPEKPEMTTVLDNATQEIEIATDEGAVVYVVIDKSIYKESKSTYNDELGKYIYKVSIPKTNAGTKMKIYAENKAGKSSTITEKVNRLVPNSPKVNAVYTDSKEIKGKANTNSIRAYALIGKESYKAKVDEEGNFSIKIPTQKEKTVITVWSINEYGEGVESKITVNRSLN